ncbi:MAG: metallophosphoesterase family protein, partial [Clostridia bacterium]
LSACLDAVIRRNPDGALFLGDYISDCPFPQKTLALLRHFADKIPCVWLRGNREDYFIAQQQTPAPWQASSQTGSLLYTYDRLTEEDIARFSAFPACTCVNYTNLPGLTACHGSPDSTRTTLHAGSPEANAALAAIQTPYLLCGHTHRQICYHAHGRTLINPGSVGLPVFERPEACFALLHGKADQWTPEFLQTPYDIEALMAEFSQSGLDDIAKVYARAVRHMLRTGGNYVMPCVREAHALAGENVLCEMHWEQAAHTLNIPSCG